LNVLIACRQSSGVAKRQNEKEGPAASWIQRHEMLLMFVLMIVSLIVLAAFIAPDLLFPATEINQQTNVSNPSNFSVIITSASEETTDAITCLASHGINDVSLVYIYSDSCSYSQANTPWVMALPAKGYNVFFVDTANASAMALATFCLRDIAYFTGTPEYVCPTTGQSKLGAFSSEIDLNKFVADCK
jgi:hypothetical protein